LQVVTYEHIKTGRGSGNIKLKVKNMRSGSVVEKSFITGARVDEASVEKKKTQFLYKDGDIYSFMDPTSFEQFTVSKQVLGDQVKFLKDGLEVLLIISEEEVLGMDLPLSLNYTVAETGPEEKGNTVSNVFKEATLDNGLVVRVPMFMKVGEKVRIDTRSGDYVERVK
jgi:elongation factor P